MSDMFKFENLLTEFARITHGLAELNLQTEDMQKRQKEIASELRHFAKGATQKEVEADKIEQAQEDAETGTGIETPEEETPAEQPAGAANPVPETEEEDENPFL